MSESTAPTTVDNPSQPPSPQPTPPQPPAQPAAPPQQHPNGPGPGAQLLDAINALPDKLVNAFREATQPARPPSTSSGDSSKGDSSSTSSTSKSGDGTGTDSTKDDGKKTVAKGEPGNVEGLTAQQKWVKWWGASR